MISYLKVTTEEGRRAWVRADEIGSFWETKVYPKPGPGRPPAEGPKAISAIILTLRGANRLIIKDETLETLVSKMRQCLGTQVNLVERAVFEGGDPEIPRGRHRASLRRGAAQSGERRPRVRQ